MHTYIASKTTFHFNSDLSGDVHITSGIGAIEVPGNDLLEFIVHWLRDQQIARLEGTDLTKLLGVKRE